VFSGSLASIILGPSGTVNDSARAMNEPEASRTLSTLHAWLTSRHMQYSELQPLTGDVSPRRYVRIALQSGQAVVAALYPQDQRAVAERFLRSGSLLAMHRVPTPRVLDWDAAAAIMLLEDAGQRTVYEEVGPGGPADEYRRRAVAILGRLTGLEVEKVEALNPPLDGPTMRRELEQSKDLVLEPRGLLGPKLELESPLAELCDLLAAAPRQPCHRDFMARNLIVDSAGRLTVIDHQDLRMGPSWYDLASLLNDSLYVEPDEETHLLNLAGVPAAERSHYHRAAAQRALKIVGTFAVFAQRGYERHLPLIAPSLRAARRHMSHLPETASIIAELSGRWDPVPDE
jgi:aminoglycoside/choline kinase family phosphotransferase